MKINKSKIFHTHNTRAIVFYHLKNSRFNLLYSFFGGMMIYYCNQDSGRM